MSNLSPAWLVLVGLSLNFFGAFLVSIEAIGAPEFLRALDKDKGKGVRFVQVGFVSAINTTFIFVLVWIITFVILSLFEHKFNVVFDLIAAPLGFFVWRLATKVADWIAFVTKLLAPPRNLYQKGWFFLIVFLVWGLGWAIIFGIASLIAIFVHFAVDLPLRFFSEKMIGPLIMRLLEKIDLIVQDTEIWHFKSTVFVGWLFLIGGFLYQIIGTVLLIIRSGGK